MLARVAAIATIAWAAACGGDSKNPTGPDQTTPVGNYTVSTVNGKALPAAEFDETNYKLEVTSGSLVLTTDGKFSSILLRRQTVPGDVSTFRDSVGGTWILSGTSVELTNSEDGSKAMATWAGLQLTLPLTVGVVTTTFVYKK